MPAPKRLLEKSIASPSLLASVVSNKFGEAVAYTLKRWDKLIEFMNCAEMTPDNNRCENLIRPFVVGRKNWLLLEVSKEQEVPVSCILIENAKLNGLVPYDYLRAFLSRRLTMMKIQTGPNYWPGILKLLPVEIQVSGDFLTLTYFHFEMY